MNSFELRCLEPSDLQRGYFDVLSALTVAPTPTQQAFDERVALMSAHDVNVFVVVDDVSNRVAGTVTVLIEPKMTRDLSFVAHIEDVAVHADYQGKAIGQRLLRHACDFAKGRGCYKVILDASEKNGGFYEKCGFSRKETQYRFDIQ
jgi:glucosamine-phosphate N-acetyltransferase